ncbi:hypothetical protein DERP_010667 [Dermatophagoides pteronyssinus]|uniref:Uncharacterized protein n=1 Tax=Dermatophagoides pteronyssinus TaxID=6956 RepID=A0ABQ8JAN2_DERPT|nr:hypothetical protein DERP_010667 [Dermatophagoides pteronyssinus]
MDRSMNKNIIYWSYGDFMENLGRHLSNKIQTNKPAQRRIFIVDFFFASYSPTTVTLYIT